MALPILCGRVAQNRGLAKPPSLLRFTVEGRRIDRTQVGVAPVRWTVNCFRDGHCTTPAGDTEIAPPWAIVAPEGTVRSPILQVRS